MEKLKARIRDLEDVLKYYAEVRNYEESVLSALFSNNHLRTTEIFRDRGMKARIALLCKIGEHDVQDN